MNGDRDGSEESEIGARNLILCRQVDFDATHPNSPYTLRSIQSVFHVRSGFPGVSQEPVWVYVEYFGAPNEYEVWFDLVRFESGNGEETDEIEEASYGPYALRLLPGLFVQGRSYCLLRLPFPSAGIYEFRLHIAGVGDALTSLRFMVEE